MLLQAVTKLTLLLIFFATTPKHTLAIGYKITPYGKADCKGTVFNTPYSGGTDKPGCQYVNYNLLDSAASLSISCVIETDRIINFRAYSEHGCTSENLLFNKTFAADGQTYCVSPHYLDDDVRCFELEIIVPTTAASTPSFTTVSATPPTKSASMPSSSTALGPAAGSYVNESFGVGFGVGLSVSLVLFVCCLLLLRWRQRRRQNRSRYGVTTATVKYSPSFSDYGHNVGSDDVVPVELSELAIGTTELPGSRLVHEM